MKVLDGVRWDYLEVYLIVFVFKELKFWVERSDISMKLNSMKDRYVVNRVNKKIL